MAPRPLVVVAVLLLAGLTYTATAAASCNPGRTPQTDQNWDGWQAGPFSGTGCLNGTYAYIKNVSPFVYSGANFTSAWTMLTNSPSSSIISYAQIGWLKMNDGSRLNFSAIHDPDTSGEVLKYYSADPVGYNALYQVEYSASNHLLLYLDGALMRDYYSPNFDDCVAYQSGEIANRDSQMPGEVGNPDPFTYANVRTGTGWFATNDWRIVVGDASGHNGAFFGHSESGNPLLELDIWDTYC